MTKNPNNERKIPLTTRDEVHYRQNKKEIDEAISEVLSRGSFVMGKEVTQFEARFADYCNTDHAVAVTSGTSSLLVALLAAGIGPGDEVVTVANADIAPSFTVRHTGADLVWADIEEDTFNIDPETLRDSISDKTKAIIIAHMYGLPADMESVNKVLAEEGRDDIVVIEDGSLAPGAEYQGKRVGELGDMGCFSVAAGKVLGVAGSGGAITTNNQEYYLNMNQVRHYGRGDSPYREIDPLDDLPTPSGTVRLGLNERMDTIQAAVGLIKLDNLDTYLDKRRSTAEIYRQVLEGSPCKFQQVLENSSHSYRVFVILVDPGIRDDLIRSLNKSGIEAGKHYVPPDHLQPYFRNQGYSEGHLPVTEKVAKSLVCLPCHPYMSVDEVWYVARTTKKLLEEI